MEILVVEDDKKIAGIIKRGLDSDSYAVHIVHDSTEGLKQGLSNDYSLMILDLKIPKKDGLTVDKELRAAGNLMPVLILTALGTTEDIVYGLGAGSDDYLTKPFALTELLARVRALVRRSEQNRGADKLYADLRLDPVSHKVWRNGQEIDLTAKEYGLLEYMMRNPETLLSRKSIFENVWNANYVVFTNIVDVYLNYLRKKLEKDNYTKLIHTVRGQSYMLRVG